MKGTKSQKKGKAKITKSKLSSRKQRQRQRQKPSKRGTTHQVARRKTGGAKQSIGVKKTLLKRKQPSRKSGVIAVKPAAKNKIVRIMGQGQFSVDNKILEKLNEIDSMLVQLVNTDRPDDNEFKKHLIELTRIVQKNGKQLDSKQIIQSDIILPSADLSVDEAKRLFIGEGVVPEI
jgi:hypothetical protein